MYNDAMNTKRGKANLTKNLGRFHMTLKDIENIQKIIQKRVSNTDFYISIGKPEMSIWQPIYPDVVDDVEDIATAFTGSTRHLKITNRAPNISLTITPLSTRINVQRVYSKGERLAKSEEVFVEIQKYYKKLKKTTVNKVQLEN